MEELPRSPCCGTPFVAIAGSFAMREVLPLRDDDAVAKRAKIARAGSRRMALHVGQACVSVFEEKSFWEVHEISFKKPEEPHPVALLFLRG